jgi:hypothetical protein
MAVVVHVVLRGVSRQQYDQVREAAGWLDKAPEGGISHLMWWEGPDCHNVDAWEDERAFDAFDQDRLGPAMEAVGVHAAPGVTIYPAHEVYVPAARTITLT